MKKIKWTIMTIVILFSITAAFAFRPHAYQTIYYYNGSGYSIAGTMGVNYTCEESTEVCTYTYSNGIYTPYITDATYTPLGITTPPAKPEPAGKKGK